MVVWKLNSPLHSSRREITARIMQVQANQNGEMKSSLGRGESDLLVFISSVMNEELDYARKTAKETIESLDFGCPWAFEFTPASSEAPEAEYLRKVAEADFVVWLVGKETTQPVANEINQCIATNRRLLVFKLPSKERDKRTSDLLEKVSDLAKWQDVKGVTELSEHIRLAFADEVIRSLRDPTPELRNKRLREMRSLSVSTCKVAWRALGVSEVLAEELSQDPEVGNVLDLPDLGAITVEGALGSGKTLAAHRLFQLATDRTIEDSSERFPILLNARELDGSLRERIERECKGYADPFVQGVFVIVDGVDETGVGEGKEILRQASVYVDANPQATVVMTTRPISRLGAIGNQVAMPALGDDEMVALINRISGRELTLNQTYGWPLSMREAAKSPLFAVMIGAKLRDNPELTFSSRSRLIERLAEDALMEGQENSEEFERLLQKLGACTVTSGTRVPLGEVDRMWAKQKLITGSRLVTESSGTVDFTLPIFREWYAARALLEGTVAISDLQQIPDRWLIPLSMALNSGDKHFVQSLMKHLASNDPGMASLLIHEHERDHEHIRADSQEDSPIPEAASRAGAEIVNALLEWRRGLGKLFSVLGPVDSDHKVRPLRIAVKGRYIETHWYHGTNDEPPVAEIPIEEVRDPLCWSLLGMSVPGTLMWPWVFTKKYLTRSMSNTEEWAKLAISSTDAVRELSWEFALSLTGRSQFTQNQLNIQDILDYVSDRNLKNYESVYLCGKWFSADDIKTIEEHLRCLLANKQTFIADPWPQSNRSDVSGPMWKLYTEQQFLARAQAVYSAALRIYDEMVRFWFQGFDYRLALYDLMPVRLEGHLEVPPQDSPPHTSPTLNYQPRLLPLGMQSEVVFELGSPNNDTVDDDRYFSEENDAYVRLRPGTARNARLFRVSSLVDGVLYPRPATRMACEWLIRDLGDLKWVR